MANVMFGRTFVGFVRSNSVGLDILGVRRLAVNQDGIIIGNFRRGAFTLLARGSRGISGTGGGTTFVCFGRSNGVGMDIRTIGRLAVVQDGITLLLFQRVAFTLLVNGSKGLEGGTWPVGAMFKCIVLLFAEFVGRKWRSYLLGKCIPWCFPSGRSVNNMLIYCV